MFGAGPFPTPSSLALVFSSLPGAAGSLLLQVRLWANSWEREFSGELAVGRLYQRVNIFLGGPGHPFLGASLQLGFRALGTVSLPGL